jgi:hypothetical protein
MLKSALAFGTVMHATAAAASKKIFDEVIKYYFLRKVSIGK